MVERYFSHFLILFALFVNRRLFSLLFLFNQIFPLSFEILVRFVFDFDYFADDVIVVNVIIVAVVVVVVRVAHIEQIALKAMRETQIIIYGWYTFRPSANEMKIHLCVSGRMAFFFLFYLYVLSEFCTVLIFFLWLFVCLCYLSSCLLYYLTLVKKAAEL